MKRRILSLFLLSVIILTALISMTGCIYRGYRGDYPELCSMAWANIPALRGVSSNGEISLDPTVIPIEEDEYGRRLFLYFETRSNYFYLIISQKTEGRLIYYYPDDCYLPCYFDDDALYHGDIGSLDEMLSLVSEEDISLLKAENDWGMAINPEKCHSTEIINKKSEGRIDPTDTEMEEYVEEYYSLTSRYLHPKNTSLVWTVSFVTADDFGRELFFVTSHITDYYDKHEVTYYYTLLVVLMPDGSCDCSTIRMADNIYDCADEVKQIKAENGWSCPID